jgi:hypothetical protein
MPGNVKVWIRVLNDQLTFPDNIPYFHDFGRMLKQTQIVKFCKRRRCLYYLLIYEMEKRHIETIPGWEDKGE